MTNKPIPTPHAVLAVPLQGLAAATILPASFCYAETIRQPALPNALDGSPIKIAVKDRGEEKAWASGGYVPAHRFATSGDLDRGIWFDKNNTLGGMKFAGRDGFSIVYELK